MRPFCRLPRSTPLGTARSAATNATKTRPAAAVSQVAAARTASLHQQVPVITSSSISTPRRENCRLQRRLTSEARPPSNASPLIHDVFEKKTGSWQYVVADPSTLHAVIIDPVLDYDAATATLSTESADALLAKIADLGYTIDMILETHAHADHITAASYLQSCLMTKQGHRPPIGIGRRIAEVQNMFGKRYNIDSCQFDGVFDKLFDDNETFKVGSLSAIAVHIPGHTPDHMAYRIGDDDIFTGDSIFHTDLGTARADFPGGSAQALFASGRKVLSLPDSVTIWTGHDYPPDGRDAPISGMTVAEHRKCNKHLQDQILEQDFVDLRKQRDAILAEPKLLHQSLQMNLRAGKLPEPTALGHRMLNVPLNVGQLEW